jgi:DNA-binding MarR family transcriptional regulator
MEPALRGQRVVDAVPLPPGAQDLDRKLAAAFERVGQAVRVQLWDQAKAHGLTPTQLQVLLRLAYDPPERRRVGALAVHLDLTQPTLSDAVAVLRRKGLVDSSRATGDARSAVLSLSGRGAELAQTLEDWDMRMRGVLAGLPSTGKEEALRLLLELIAGLQREGVVTVARICVTCRFFMQNAHGHGQHHCALLDLPLDAADLRVDCPEHERAA